MGCSVDWKPDAFKQLNRLRPADRSRIAGSISDYARDYPAEILDHPRTRLRSWRPDVGRKRFGSHRVFYMGRACRCHYDMIWIKLFKKDGTDDENDPGFREIVENAAKKNAVTASLVADLLNRPCPIKLPRTTTAGDLDQGKTPP
jgi:mRNA-degrading endonuclease RelE of RelBE toxin-antitoxin system